MYLRADVLLVLPEAIQFMSQRIEWIRRAFDVFWSPSETVANILKSFALLCFGWWIKRTKSAMAFSPVPGKLRPSSKLDDRMVKAIYTFAQKHERRLKEYLYFTHNESVHNAKAEPSSGTSATTHIVNSGSDAKTVNIITSVTAGMNSTSMYSLRLESLSACLQRGSTCKDLATQLARLLLPFTMDAFRVLSLIHI